MTSLLDKLSVENWFKLTNQNDYVLNMMCPCLQNTALSEFEALECMYSFKTRPMATPGTECLVHLKPVFRTTWDFHALDAWYIVPALKNHRCFKLVRKQKNASILTDTIKFKHHSIPIMKVKPVNHIVKSKK